MNKVLILGCSFSAGNWALIESRNEEWAEELHDDYGWYDELPDNNEYTVYSHIGGGYLNYAYILQQIDLTQYSKCIIQETWEPRVCVYANANDYNVTHRNNITQYQKQGMKDFVKIMARSDMTPMVERLEERHFTKLDLSIRNYLTNVGESVYFNTAVSSCAIAINNILEDANISAWRFSVTEPSARIELPYCKHIKEIDITEDMLTIFDLHRTGSGYPEPINSYCGHLTKTGTQMLGQAVANKLKDAL